MVTPLMGKAEQDLIATGKKTHAVVDSKTNGVCQMYVTPDEAKASAAERNERAAKLGVNVRYSHVDLTP